MIGLSIVTAIAHSLWQGPVAWLAVVVADVALARGRPQTRHAIRVVAFAAWLSAFVATAWPSTVAPIALARPVAGGVPAWVAGVAIAWAFGVALGSVHVAIGLWRLRRWRRQARPVSDAVQALADRLADALSVRRVAVRAHPEITTPCLLGLLSPLVLLPAGMAARVSPQVLHVALVHELVHLRRLDPWINAMVVLARVVLFFHPVAWWLAAEIRTEREHACDAVAAQWCGGTVAYGRALVELEAYRGRIVLGVPAMAGPPLRRRVERLVGRPPEPVRRGRVWLLALTLLPVLALVPGPGLRPDPHPTTIDIAWLPRSVQAHAPHIVEAGRRHGVDPRLLAIVVLVESGGDPQATSPVGARGLMQLMPATASELVERRGQRLHDLDALYDPAVSLDLGAEYLAAQLRRFEGRPDRIELAAAAYNAGPGRVAAWQRGTVRLPAETRRYRELVRRLWRERDAPRSATLAARG